MTALLTSVSLLVGAVASGGVAHSASTAAVEIGRFSKAFVEPTVNGVRTSEKCVPHKGGGPQPDERWDCKPAAVTLAINPTRSAVYFNGIEGSEEIQNGIVPELGNVSANDLAR